MRWLLALTILAACGNEAGAPQPSTPSNSIKPTTSSGGTAAAAPTPNTPDKNGLHASAELSPVYNVSKIAAKLALSDVNGKDVEVTGTVTGMDPGTYVLHYHTPRGCFPTDGDPKDQHVSALGEITPDGNGSANVTFTIQNARLGGMNPIDDFCLIVYSSDGSKFLSYGKILGQAMFGTGN